MQLTLGLFLFRNLHNSRRRINLLGGSNTVRLTLFFTGLESIKHVNLMQIQNQSIWIHTKQTGGQPYRDTSLYGECSLPCLILLNYFDQIQLSRNCKFYSAMTKIKANVSYGKSFPASLAHTEWDENYWRCPNSNCGPLPSGRSDCSDNNECLYG